MRTSLNYDFFHIGRERFCKIKNKDELPMFMSVQDMIALLGLSRTKAYELVGKEGFPKLNIVPGRIIIPRDKLLAWLDENTIYTIG